MRALGNIVVYAIGSFFITSAFCLMVMVGTLGKLATDSANSTTGRVVINYLLGPKTFETEASKSDFLDGAPDIFAEVKALGEGEIHPIVKDLMERLQAKYRQAPDLVDIIQYRNYVFYDLVAEDGNWLYIYRWDGADWVFVEAICVR